MPWSPMLHSVETFNLTDNVSAEQWSLNRMFAASIYEITYPNFDPVLPPFYPGDHDLQVSTPPETVSHFQDIAHRFDMQPPLDFPLLGLSQPIATVLTSVQHVSQVSAYPTCLHLQLGLTMLTACTTGCLISYSRHFADHPDTNVYVTFTST